MEEINLLPVIDEVLPWPDGRIKRIMASCEGKPILVNVVDGGPKRISNEEFPYFEIPHGKIHQFYRTIGGIISDGKKMAERFKSVKKADWATSLEACGITIAADGKVIIPRRQVNKETGEKKRILMGVKDINAAVRQTQHIRDSYDSKLPDELARILKKLGINRLYLELRREVLLYAKQQMQTTIDEAYVRYRRIAAIATDKSGPDFNVLADKIAQLAFFLKNQWACPYLHDVKLAISHLNQAKSAAARQKLDSTLLHLLKTKLFLKDLTKDKEQCGEKLSKIDPIKTLAEVDKQNKTDEVLVLAKSRLGGTVFHLTDMLLISREVLDKPKSTTPQEKFSHSVVLQPAISRLTTLTYHPASAPQSAIITAAKPGRKNRLRIAKESSHDLGL